MASIVRSIGRAFTAGIDYVSHGALPMSGFSGGGRYGGSRTLFYGLLPGAKRDYQRIAGDLYRNSIVSASINWISRNLPQAPPCVYRNLPDGTQQIVPKHPMTSMLMRPNPYYDGRTLRQATMLSLITAGSAYWYIVRDARLNPMELWYLPHFQCRPYWQSNSTTDTWIEGYAYTQGGETIALAFEDVIHMRDGLDPDNPRSGMSPLASAFREVCTDNEAAGYAAALLMNMGVPGAIISPATPEGRIQADDLDVIKAEYEESVGGDERGRPMVLTGPIKVDRLMLSPEELMLTTAQDKPVERICALIGIPPGVLNLGVGLKKSTYNNREADRESAWVECIIPRLELINSELDTQLLPYFGDPKTENAGCDYRNVRALQESQDALYKRLTAAVGGPWVTPNEARANAGYAKLDSPEADELYPAPTAADPIQAQGEDTPTADGKGKDSNSGGDTADGEDSDDGGDDGEGD